MLLAGVPVSPALVRQLAALLDDEEPLRRKLQLEISGKGSIVTLTVQDRVALLGALGESPPSGLRALRDTLLNELKRGETQARRSNTTTDTMPS